LIQKEKGSISSVLEEWGGLSKSLGDVRAMLELAIEAGGDQEMLEEAGADSQRLTSRLDDLETRTLLSGENDSRNCFFNINSGSGGTESQDWAQMLLRMLLRWCEKKSFDKDIVEVSVGEEAGIKSATVHVKGAMAFGLLRAESGVHRLVRISPFDSNKRRHTSFASVYVYPEADEDVPIEIKDEDLRIDVYRSSGAGGQSVNTSDSAVRITHLPTGIVVACQQERSQMKNRSTGMKILKARLYERRLEEERARLAKIESTKKANEWGSQIRSYVLHPYRLVKDHRTGESTSSADDVLDGQLDPFIRSFLLFDKGMIERKGGADDLE
jgi:peptide chain release factor 2